MEHHSIEHANPVQHWVSEACAGVARHEQGLTRIDAIAGDILRVRFSPSGRLSPTRDWTPTIDLPPAGVSAIEEGGQLLRLETETFGMTLDLATGRLGCFNRDGTTFAEDLAAPQWREVHLSETALLRTSEPELPEGDARTGLILHKHMADEEGYFGFGQHTGHLDRRHRRITHWTVDHSMPGRCREGDNQYQAHPTFMAVRPGFAWGLFMNSTSYSLFDVGAARDGVLSLFTLGGQLDYFIFAGPTPAAVLEQLTRLTGRPLLPPQWALGYHQSRWSYGSDHEVRTIAQEFRGRGIPLDAIHLDIDYMREFRVFTWDAERFTSPADTINSLHEQGIRAVAIVDPAVKCDIDNGYGVADSGVSGEHFLRLPDNTLYTGFVWPGESLFPDFYRPQTRAWWGTLHSVLTDVGIDGIWCDMNEPAIVDRPFNTPGVQERAMPLALQHGSEQITNHLEIHNLYGTLMCQATWEGLEQLRPDRRPWLLTRSGFTGVQRWAASWMGDNEACWEQLQASLPQLASMGLSGSPHVGVDIGGFYRNSFAELYARWMEVGAFYPFMRCHTHCDSRPQEPWSFGADVEEIVHRAIELRYRLLPYLYTLAHRAHRTGEPMFRPLLFDFPHATDLHQIEDQIMIGPQIMIAPVCAPGVQRRLVEMPPGTWYDFRTGGRVCAESVIAYCPLGNIPIYVRGGSILTFGNPRQSTSEPVTELTLEAYPDPERNSEWVLIEDDGESNDYRNHLLAETPMQIASEQEGSTLSVAAREGAYVPPERTIIVKLHLPQPPVRVLLDDSEISWHWDEWQQAAVITVENIETGFKVVPVYDGSA